MCANQHLQFSGSQPEQKRWEWGQHLDLFGTNVRFVAALLAMGTVGNCQARESFLQWLQVVVLKLLPGTPLSWLSTVRQHHLPMATQLILHHWWSTVDHVICQPLVLRPFTKEPELFEDLEITQKIIPVTTGAQDGANGGCCYSLQPFLPSFLGFIHC